MNELRTSVLYIRINLVQFYPPRNGIEQSLHTWLPRVRGIVVNSRLFSFFVVATAILASCNEEFEELTTINIPNYRDGVYSGDNLTFTVDGEPRTVNSVTISSRQVGNDTLYSDNLKKHYLNPIYVTNVIIKGFPGKKDRLTIPAISSVDKLRGYLLAELI